MQNEIDKEFTPEQLKTIDEALTALESATADLRVLSSDEKAGLVKAPEGARAWMEQMVTRSEQNLGKLSRDYDPALVRRDLNLVTAIEPRQLRAQRIVDRLASATFQGNSDAFAALLGVRRQLKDAGVAGVDELGGLNLYAFVNNDPEDYFDDFGQQARSAPQQQKPQQPPTPKPPTNKPPANPTEPPPIPPDPNNPANDADRQTREQFARDIMNQFQAWKNRNKCCNLDLCTLISQWMYESNWGRSRVAGGKNLGGMTGEGPAGTTGNFRKYHNFPEFYNDYTGLVCNAKRYADAIGKKGQDYVDALKKAGYDATDPNYADNVMKIYKQLGCK